jgi:ferredoxin--NADP+ reductase
MAYVIAQSCCSDASCLAVCPVQCIRPRPGDADFATTEQLYIDPATCIDCGACVDACPVDAISPDFELPEHLVDYSAINAAYFGPANTVTLEAPPRVHKRTLPEDRPVLRIAIVGAGAAGCYAAAELSAIPGVQVTMLERLPTPFGLVRSGVAPDHQDTKLVGDYFRAVLSRRSVSSRYLVDVGRDLSLDDLLEHHHAVIHAGGASGDRRLGIPGEELPGSHSAREFVAWYNAHPDHLSDAFALDGRRAVVIGNGNVALDVARVLTMPIDELGATDVADHALDALASSAIEEVVLAGRRGAGQISCTSKELLALSRLAGVTVRAEGLGTAETPSGAPRPEGAAAARALVQELLRDAAAVPEPPEGAAGRRVVFRFLRTPVSINGAGRVESVTFSINELVEADDGMLELRATGRTETVEAGLVLRAVGYRGNPWGGLPFDDARGIIPNRLGRVVDPVTELPLAGVYCAGWIKRGATGVIGTNKSCSAETVAALLEDFGVGRLADPTGAPEAFDALVHERAPDSYDHAGWTRIDRAERDSGRAERRPRVKFVALEDFLRASREHG